MHKIAILAVNNVVALDLAIPVEIFNLANAAAMREIYDVRTCGETSTLSCGDMSISVPYTLADLACADTIIVPGSRNPAVPCSPDVTKALHEASGRGARIASICNGAFVLAEAGLLDGLTATTHWNAAALLEKMYPAVDVDPGPIFIDHGHIMTSAGLSAGLDLCLHIVRKDFGQAIAADVAKHAVAPLNREGTQAQFIRREAPKSMKDLGDLLFWLSENCARKLKVADIAKQANMSERTLSRRFHEQLGTTPLHWLTGERIRQAQVMLETTAFTINEIAFATGFDNPGSLRTRFRQMTGISPASYRRLFNERLGLHRSPDVTS